MPDYIKLKGVAKIEKKEKSMKYNPVYLTTLSSIAEFKENDEIAEIAWVKNLSSCSSYDKVDDAIAKSI